MVIPEFRPRDQRGERFVLERERILPERLSDRRSRSRGRGPRTGIGASGEPEESRTGARPSCILEDFSAETGTPLLIEVMDEITGDSIPSGIP